MVPHKGAHLAEKMFEYVDCILTEEWLEAKVIIDGGGERLSGRNESGHTRYSLRVGQVTEQYGRRAGDA